MDKEFIKQGLELIKKADAAYLTTIDKNGFPSTRAMLNLKNEKQFPKLVEFMSQFDNEMTLFFTTNTSSTKVGQVTDNTKVAVYFCDPKSWHGFLCQGDIEVVMDRSVKHAIWQQGWEMYYPDGIDSEDYAVLKLKPNYVKSYYQFHQAELKL